MEPREPRPFSLIGLLRYPMGLLLLCLLLVIAASPLADVISREVPGLLGPAALAPFALLLTGACGYAVWESARYRSVMILLAGLVVLFLLLSSILLHRAFIAAHLIAQTVFLAYAGALITRIVFRARVVDVNILCGAACIYLMLGMFFGFIYALIDFIAPGGFTMTADQLRLPPRGLASEPGMLLYFSFSTLTTVGFGDIVPARSWSRTLSILEAILGQILLVFMIARLVGLHVAHSALTRGHSSTERVEPD